MNPVRATHGQQALMLLHKANLEGKPYELALIDYEMPEMNGFTLAEQIKQNPDLRHTRLIMVSSYDQSGNSALCRSIGIEGYLTKPVGQDELLLAIRTVLGLTKNGEIEVTSTPGVLNPIDTSLQKSLRILMAEDNEINQEVAQYILKEAGHQVVVAVNGQEAVARWQEAPFDLILMDIHMPEMDGFEATTAIREAELATGRHIPIIALTANAIKGDSERCLQAGMDGYISKPFRKQELLDAVHSVNLSHHSFREALT